ncbi:class I SAM-dependent methyltransferase [Candidatus Daviesbacteria bacterium]|nr:class I SAM-dependent methyltransferase [Candidatus Daviesbacteria bacterium]
MKYFKRYLEVAPLSLAIWRSLEAQAISTVKLKRPVLDIGCGFGEFGGVFFDSFIEVGVDISKSDIALAAQQKKYKKLTLADARNLPFKENSFNTVISISSLEHIKGVEEVFKESYRVLKPGGTLIFTVHTLELNRLLFLPLKRDFFIKIYHKIFKHEINQTKEDWIKMVKKMGFEVVEVRGTISKLQLMIFQFALPFGIHSQIFRKLFKKRMLFTHPIRARILYKLFKWVVDSSGATDANIMIVAKK